MGGGEVVPYLQPHTKTTLSVCSGSLSENLISILLTSCVRESHCQAKRKAGNQISDNSFRFHFASKSLKQNVLCI